MKTLNKIFKVNKEDTDTIQNGLLISLTLFAIGMVIIISVVAPNLL